ncbi:condensation domain-containing protein [Tengunoibacter tsumagoiensis]|uniref:Condensation domain-containing protein n=1 Tax=Tengunoibacter tsumagoiensis TaxID=2014871 RepID=A0A402A667_9CHLR|nr:condensation domain-containing protein [Tengunoibacter tsumagoiensis]GCE14622.1 hypothetical protein KTT_44810 [Tengunoibacter tsumagoiensis]
MGEKLTQRLAALSPEQQKAFLSKLMERRTQQSPEEVTGPVILNANQQGHMWYTGKHLPLMHVMPSFWEMQTDIHPQHLEDAVKLLISYHDELRACFVEGATQWEWGQNILPSSELNGAPWTIRIDISHLDAEGQWEYIQQYYHQAMGLLDLFHGKLIHVAFFYRGEQETGRLLFITSRLIADMLSLETLIDDLSTFYRAYSEGNTPRLAPKTTSMQEYGSRMSAFAHSQEGLQHIHALNELRKTWPAPGTLTILPPDNPDGDFSWVKFGQITQEVSAETTERLVAMQAKHHIQMNELLFTAYIVALQRRTKETVFPLRIPSFGRNTPFSDMDLSHTVGNFAFYLNEVFQIPEESSPAVALQSVLTYWRKLPERDIASLVLSFYKGSEDIDASLDIIQPYDAKVEINYRGQYNEEVETAGLGLQGMKSAPEVLPYPPGFSEYKSANTMKVVVMILFGKLHITWQYGIELYQETTIEAFGQEMITVLEELSMLSHLS